MVTREVVDDASCAPRVSHSSPGGRTHRLWITWEVQRRTTELARHLDLRLVRLLHDGPRWRRYPVLLAATLRELVRSRPKILFVQNPSMMLTAFACILRPVFRYGLVVDRHSNFMFGRTQGILKSSFLAVSDFTLRHADLTIVTNDHLSNIVYEKGGRPFVLQDPFPKLSSNSNVSNRVGDRVEGLFVCTYSDDEPFEKVFEAASKLRTAGRLIVSGKPPKSGFEPSVAQVIDGSDVIHIAGFLSEQDYVDTMRRVDFVLVLTTLDHCLVCGAYEAISLGKPLILSDKRALREYFGQGPLYIDNSVPAIHSALASAFEGHYPKPQDTIRRRQTLEEQWVRRFAEFKAELAGIVQESQGPIHDGE